MHANPEWSLKRAVTGIRNWMPREVVQPEAHRTISSNAWLAYRPRANLSQCTTLSVSALTISVSSRSNPRRYGQDQLCRNIVFRDRHSNNVPQAVRCDFPRLLDFVHILFRNHYVRLFPLVVVRELVYVTDARYLSVPSCLCNRISLFSFT